MIHLCFGVIGLYLGLKVETEENILGHYFTTYPIFTSTLAAPVLMLKT